MSALRRHLNEPPDRLDWREVAAERWPSAEQVRAEKKRAVLPAVPVFRSRRRRDTLRASAQVHGERAMTEYAEKVERECPDCEGRRTVITPAGGSKDCGECDGAGFVEVYADEVAEWDAEHAKLIAPTTDIALTLLALEMRGGPGQSLIQHPAALGPAEFPRTIEGWSVGQLLRPQAGQYLLTLRHLSGIEATYALGAELQP